jgi:hypothetical protein
MTSQEMGVVTGSWKLQGAESPLEPIEDMWPSEIPSACSVEPSDLQTVREYISVMLSHPICGNLICYSIHRK